MECFADAMRFPKRVLEKARLSGNHERISFHAFIDWVHSSLFGEEAPKVRSIRPDRDPNCISEIYDRDIIELEKKCF